MRPEHGDVWDRDDQAVKEVLIYPYWDAQADESIRHHGYKIILYGNQEQGRPRQADMGDITQQAKL